MVRGGDTVSSAASVAYLMLGASLAFLAGVGVQLAQPVLPPRALLGGVLVLGLLALAAGLWCRLSTGQLTAPVARRRLAGPLLLAAPALLGWAQTGWQATERLATRLPHALEGLDLVVTGVVADLPQRLHNGQRFEFRPEAAHRLGDPVVLPPRLLLGWYSGWHEDATRHGPLASLRAGQRWTFTLRLRRPHGTLNPHGYDVELAWFERGIGATGYVRDGPVPARLLAEAAGHPVARARQALRDAIEAAVPDRRASGVLAALSLGDQSAIDRSDWALFRDTGIAHLMAISGLHVTMFAWLAAWLVATLWRLSPRACLRLPAPHAGRWIGLLLAIAYAVFSGWGVPSQRTVWMLALVTLLQSLGRRWPWPMVLASAAVLVTSVDPWALLQPGFWLSFVAVALLMASDPVRQPLATPSRWRRRLEPLWQGLRTQWVATLGLTPLSLVFFQQVSVVGLLANLVAIPLVTLVITPLALLGVFWTPLWWLGALLVQGLGEFLAWIAAWSGAVWRVAVAPVWAQLAGLLAAVLLILPWPWRLRLLALPLALPMLLPPRELPDHGRFELIALDVGQGSAVLVSTRHHLLVYDAGPQYSRDTDAGQRVLLPLLQGRGEWRIDRLLLSHRDSDHVGGAAALLRTLPVGELLSSLEPEHPLLQTGVAARPCLAGQAWTWDGVDFEVLHPLQVEPAPGLKPNALSCVLRVAAGAPGGGSALLTGDIERRQELALVAATPSERLASTVLLVPHHGSRTSSSEVFLDAVQAKVGLVQAGYRNRFGHPVEQVLARHRARGTQVVESTRCGAWTWQGDAALQTARCERERRRRHWHDQPAPADPHPLR